MIDENKRFDEFNWFSIDELKMILRETIKMGLIEDREFIEDLANEIHRREKEGKN